MIASPNGRPPAEVFDLLAGRLAERGLTVDDMKAAGFKLRQDRRDGWIAVRAYRRADGRAAERRFVLRLTKAEGNWRWAPGARAKGSVLDLGDVERAAVVVVTEGESDALCAWRHLAGLGNVAVLGVPGAKMVENIANIVNNTAMVVIATDADTEGDECAAEVKRQLLDAGHGDRLLHRLRPDEGCDLRNFIDVATPDGFLAAIEVVSRTEAPVTVELEHEPVQVFDGNLAGLLVDVAGLVRRMVVVTDDQAGAIALWVAHTHAIDAAESTPYIAVTSAEKRSGKSKLLELLALLARNAILTANISTAALFRVIDMQTPTVFVDEADAIFARRNGAMREAAEELRGLLNAGHRRGAVVYRMVGQGAAMVPQPFSVFGAKALAAIGELPDTIADRSIVIRMKRKGRGEHVERFRRREVEPEAAAVRGLLASWAQDAADALTSARPALPAELDDRAADGWEALLAIADAAGGTWPASARKAALALSAGRDGQEGEVSIGVRLLGDIRAVFDESTVDRMTSAGLAKALAAIEEAPWGDLRGRVLDARGLARRLRPFEVIPRTIRTTEGTAKGYLREQFEDAWSRYLNPPVTAPGTSQPSQRHNPDYERDHEGFPSVTTAGVLRIEKGPEPASRNDCDGVTAGNTVDGERGDQDDEIDRWQDLAGGAS